MAAELQDDISCWYVLNHIATTLQEQAKKVVDTFNRTEETSLELFAPTYVVRETKNGEVRMKSVNLTFHYVFVRGTLAQVKQLCSQSNGFSFLLDRSSRERYAVISDRDMRNFKNIARAYKNCLPYFSLEDVDLEDGDLVEVIHGDFPGLVGTYMPKAKSNSGDIVLHICNNVGTIAFDVKATDVRVLEFSHNSTRANDQIDAVIPHILTALQYYKEESELPSNIAARLSVFCSRMGVVKLNNRKLDAKLQALLYGANYILGNTDEADFAMAKYEKLKESVTNVWTSGLISLILLVLINDIESLKSKQGELLALAPTSKLQRMIIEEYARYTA